MRKLLGIVICLCLTICLSIVIYAQDIEEIVPNISLDKIYVAAPNSMPIEVLQNDGVIIETIEPNSTVYFVIENADRAEDLANVKAIVGDFQRGEEFIGTPVIEYCILYDSTGANIGYHYVVALPVLSLAGEHSADVTGKVTVSKRWTPSERVKFNFTITATIQKEATEYMCTSTNFPIVFGINEKNSLIRFDSLARFEVLTQGQGEVNVGFSTQALTDIAAAYPKEKLRFISWTKNPIFNRVGTLYINAEPDEYLYEVTPNGLADLTYSFSIEEEAFMLETRRLSNYVISENPLGEFITPKARPNPLTGASIRKKLIFF